jgi:SAM-dependent methyltransferase
MSGSESRDAKLAWQDEGGKKWVRNQARTDAQLGPIGRLALDALLLHESESVLDVGCGAGQTLFELAARVGPQGHVLGLDVSPPLVEYARHRVQEGGASNIELMLGDAAQVRPSRPMDALFSRFGVMFFDDALAAFKNLRNALRAGGRMSFVCWQGMEDNPWATVPLRAIQRIVPDTPLPAFLEPGQPGPFRFADAAWVQALLLDAGFSGVQVATHRQNLVVGGAQTVDEAVEFLLEIGPGARLAAASPPELWPRFRAALTAALEPHQSARGIELPSAVYVVTAHT